MNLFRRRSRSGCTMIVLSADHRGAPMVLAEWLCTDSNANDNRQPAD